MFPARVPQKVREFLAEQDADVREVLDKVVEGWLEPAERLDAMQGWGRNESNGDESEEAPAYHVPSAEGIAVYQGMFGPNGNLSPEDKELLRKLLKAPATEPDPENEP